MLRSTSKCLCMSESVRILWLVHEVINTADMKPEWSAIRWLERKYSTDANLIPERSHSILFLIPVDRDFSRSLRNHGDFDTRCPSVGGFGQFFLRFSKTVDSIQLWRLIHDFHRTMGHQRRNLCRIELVEISYPCGTTKRDRPLCSSAARMEKPYLQVYFSCKNHPDEEFSSITVTISHLQ